MRYVRLKIGSAGESHFEQTTLDLKEADYRPPAPLMFVSHTYEADGLQFLRLPSGWSGEFNPSSQTSISHLLERSPRNNS